MVRLFDRKGGLISLVRNLLGAAICQAGAVLLRVGLRVGGELPDKPSVPELPWADRDEGVDLIQPCCVVGARVSESARRMLVAVPDPGRVVNRGSTVVTDGDDEPTPETLLEGSAAWRRKRP